MEDENEKREEYKVEEEGEAEKEEAAGRLKKCGGDGGGVVRITQKGR